MASFFAIAHMTRYLQALKVHLYYILIKYMYNCQIILVLRDAIKSCDLDHSQG